MKKKLCCLLIVLIPMVLFADTITLTTGAVVEGKLIRLSETSATLLKADSTTVEYALVHVREIHDPAGGLLFGSHLPRMFGVQPLHRGADSHSRLFPKGSESYLIVASGMGRLIDNGQTYNFFGDDWPNGRLFYRRIQETQIELLILYSNVVFSVEHNYWEQHNDPQLRLLITAGPSFVNQGSADYAYSRFGLLLASDISEEDADWDLPGIRIGTGGGADFHSGFIVPVWGVYAGKKIDANWNLRGGWYVNPLAYVRNWMYNFAVMNDTEEPVLVPDASGVYYDLPPYKRSPLWGYISGFNLSISREIVSGCAIDAGVASTESVGLELTLKLSWTNIGMRKEP